MSSRRHRNRLRAKRVADPLGLAEKKLRHAKLFLWHLEQATAKSFTEGESGELEAYFGAAMNDAKSAFYVLHHAKAPFQNAQRQWRATVGTEETEFFDKMKDLRDDDVHSGDAKAQRLQTFIDADDWRLRHESAPHAFASRFFHNAGLFGPRPVMEVQKPDGEVLRASSIQGAIGLYIEGDDGQPLDAAK